MESCKDLIKIEFDTNIKGGMVTASQLKKRDKLSRYQLSTIKSSLSKLKKEKVLMVSFRINGKILRSIEGPMKFYPGKCYYKLK